MGYIYKITNKCNDKIYIGQTRQTIEQRWSGHKHSAVTSDAPLYRAMRKYGIENFQIDVIIKCNNNNLNNKEIYYINYYNSYVPNGYNATLGGDGHTVYDYQKIIQDYYNMNENISKVCEINNCDYTVVKRALDEYNIQSHQSYDHLLVKIYEIDEAYNIIKIFNNSQEIIDTYSNLTIKGLNDYLSDLNRRTYNNHYFCREYEYNKHIRNLRDKRKTKIICLTTGQQFNSLSDAARWIKANSNYKTDIKGMTSNISRAIKKQTNAYGYKWDWIA